MVYVHLPFMILPLYTNLEKHDPTLLDAAQDLGANAWHRFWRVTFPLSLPGIFSGSALVFIPVLGMFAIPEILGGKDDWLVGNLIKEQLPRHARLAVRLDALDHADHRRAGDRRARRRARAQGDVPCVGPRCCGPRRSRSTRSSTCRSSSSSSSASTTASSPPSGSGFTTDWYRKLFENEEMLAAAVNSLVIAFVAAGLATVLGTMAGIAMHRYRSKILPFMVLTPIAMPEILLGVALLIFFIRRSAPEPVARHR